MTKKKSNAGTRGGRDGRGGAFTFSAGGRKPPEKYNNGVSNGHHGDQRINHKNNNNDKSDERNDVSSRALSNRTTPIPALISHKQTSSSNSKVTPPKPHNPTSSQNPPSSLILKLFPILQVIQTGITQKRSPFQLKNWIACVLTLDGRDKFTKVLQYGSRLLSWYFGGLAAGLVVDSAGMAGGDGASSGLENGGSGLSAILSQWKDTHLQKQFYHILSQRFYSLYKSLVESRKAFRIGRSLIELDKLKSMGWGEYLRFMVLHPLAEGAAGSGGNIASNTTIGNDASCGAGANERNDQHGGGRSSVKEEEETRHFGRYDTHPIEEEDEEGSHADEDEHEHGENQINQDLDEDERSWNEDDEDGSVSDGGSTEEKKSEDQDSPHSSGKGSKYGKAAKEKVIARPGRPVLPSRISSNVGWGPATTTYASTGAVSTSTSTANANASPTNNSTNLMASSQSSKPPRPPTRTVSEMGRSMYRPFPQRSSSMGSYKQVRESSDTGDAPSKMPPPQLSLSSLPPPPTPAWKLIGGTLKLIGLMGFWAFDNISFLTGTGFLDPMHLVFNTKSAISLGESKLVSATNAKDRMQRKARASQWAARFYFMGVLAGLYVNVREVWRHSGVLKEARRKLKEMMKDANRKNELHVQKEQNSQAGQDDAQGMVVAQQALKKVEGKHFVLLLALLKSICDFTVFSNNPGVDWHLKWRGKKNHEGMHCLSGLVSASTVLYNNFPNAD